MAESSRLTAELGAEADTAALGEQLAGLVARTDRARPVLIALSGPLGAGKTTLVRSFLRSLGHSGAVRSPTYTLVEVYEFTGFNVAHLDLYRLGDDSELEFLGYRDFSESGWVVLVEWPERAGRALGTPDLTVALDYSGTGRSVVIESGTDWGEAIIANLNATAGAGDQDFSPRI
ncbi:MAG: tRNA (adenosine(37)-N6)-threonylcarbamoyltransferase complex ATPase subunit type 1 TsaE [Chromatiales bacterium]|jgi:tRNA threonylcarbamoyladenosine biosynthesis protein TsaE|nr:tRNA (adenosine(37)-N6)-threonylcarbamoyltransferase complex ATPase subunit type 1 TsaE [Chromatiales bacterium]MDH3893067.1 tRNA (adenosine(37)-N6)-threonylcarbamoyltransferase complex ATPase subunit type 1 TsaE [Chromatiales bacterium]MDH3930688.1 tRNA (adenosine(37)-N6)-threonylcarbamoyltransferase complex ATPase subunit type 1 TsaE [Chromatiales bacterium]MDH4013464.1 tRNA (adenosine(37)-N6)-threonylcarbamoyltransferase complex ATPase subunit type 1 TsaE [Chromatiales bacterium]PLX56154.